MRTFVLAAAIAATMAGCSTMVEVRNDARVAQASTLAKAESLYAQRSTAVPASGAIITDAPYVDVRAMRKAPSYPPAFRRTVTVNEPLGIPMQTLAQRVQAMTGTVVLYQSEIVGGGSAAMESPVAVARGGDDSVTGGLPPLSEILPAVSPAASSPRTSVAISYTGDVVGLFNAIAGATGSSWEYDDAGRSVTFFKYKTQTFRVPAVQGSASSAAVMGGASQGGGEQSLSNATATGSYKAEASIWGDLDAVLKRMVSPEGVYVISQSTGTVTVRDRPDRIEQVRRYMDDTIASMSRQVDVELTIYRVMVSDSDMRALNWSALFQAAAGKYGIALDSMGNRPAADGSTSLTVTIPETNQKWGGSQVVMDALSTLGRTSVEQSTSIVTSNNQPAPFKVVRRTSYLRELAQGMVQSGGTQMSTGPTLTPGVVETGLNMYVIPHVMDDGKRLKLRMMGSISTLERMNQIGSATQFIQAPDTASREFQSETWLNSGETLVLAGFQQLDTGMTTKSPLDKSLWLLGGSSQASKTREIVVIAIRPIVTAVRSRI